MQSLRRPLEPLRQIRVLRLIIWCRRLILHKREEIACMRQDWYLYVMHLISKVPWHMEIALNSLFTWYLLIIFVTLQKKQKILQNLNYYGSSQVSKLTCAISHWEPISQKWTHSPKAVIYQQQQVVIRIRNSRWILAWLLIAKTSTKNT